MSLVSSKHSIFSSSESQAKAIRQSEYVRRSEEIVVEGTQRLASAVEEGQNLIEVFDELLIFLAQNRHEIAVSAGDKDAHQFGRRRDVGDLNNEPFMITPLDGQYLDYNKALLSDFQARLSEMPHTEMGFQQKKMKISGEPVMGRENSTEFLVIDKSNRKTLTYIDPVEHRKMLTQLTSEGLFNEEKVHKAFTQDRDALYQFKKAYPTIYKKLKLMGYMQYLYSRFEGQKSHWVVVTRRTQIGQQMYPSSQYLTWMHCNYNDDPVENMTDVSFIAIMHQDPFLIKRTLLDVAQLFKQSIETDPNNREALINLVGLFEVQLAHVTPFHRGSAAVSEWLEKIIYRYHGLTLRYTEGVSVNLKALTLDLKPFIDQYPEMIELTETPDQEHELGSSDLTI
ncbi:MAG: hypothetical protein K0U37_07690 [Gammaproteobacteria bacterium]|nr:hypothetical protein [Gammaproteobacteria bacterium]